MKLEGSTRKAGATKGTPRVLPQVAATESVDSSPMLDPTEEEIARLAYCYWDKRLREGQAGSAEDDWFQARQNLTQRIEAGSPAA